MRWLWCSLLVIVVDQTSKILATGALSLHEPVVLLSSLNLTLVHNTGAAFSFLSSASGWQRWFFVVLALVVCSVIFFWLRRLPAGNLRQGIALSLVLGGALGNVWDRVRFGYVVDFIDVYYKDWHWPVFNIADSAITVGAFLLVIDAFVGSKPRTVNRKQ